MTESIGELLTQDPYHRHLRLIGVMKIITRLVRYTVFRDKPDVRVVRPPGFEFPRLCENRLGFEAWEAPVLTILDYGR